ncbi:carboxylesterase 1C [Agrilus planipennis]|uniref:Carboxylesterase 1C n=1 Tax=Agrilus planipennis TaxID=224129 RepID=A0A7F5RHY8_AGRPL|nr:carboxylesterase 1C [Agrilus planipennis]
MCRLIIIHLFIFCPCFGRDPPTVDIPSQGTIMGKEISMIRTKTILAFLGIPYAQPPLENLRFAPPVTNTLPSWDDIKNATQFAPACLQTEKDINKQDMPFLKIISNQTFETSEDCLYLNVFVPIGKPPTEKFATIIWFHPGNFTTGNPAMWNPYELVFRHQVIVVTVAFRLNILGFFTTMDGEAPGNYGLMDQQAAMMWVKNNINIFGGNPDNICIMGYGTGALSVGIHMVNSQSRELFNKAIAMSGNFMNPTAVKYPNEDKKILDEIAEYFACYRTPTSDLINCLRRAAAQNLVAFTSSVNWRPLIDIGLSNTTPPFLPRPPKAFFEEGDFAQVPFLTGYTNMENALSIDMLDPEMVQDKQINDEFLKESLEQLAQKDLPPLNENDSCIYNYDHVSDSVLFFYGSQEASKDPNKTRKVIIDYVTEKNFGASTFLNAQYVSKLQKTYVYRFDMKPSTSAVITDIPEWVSAPHLFDLIYIWGIPFWVPLKDQEWDGRDKRTSITIMSLWTNFAKYSNPTESNTHGIRWDVFTPDNPGILIIDRIFNMSDQSKLNYKAFEFWNDYYPKVVEVATQCCNATDSSISIYWSTDSCFHIFIMIFVGLLTACKGL